MKLFRRGQEFRSEQSREGMRPAVKSSICTGERVAGFLDAGGRFQDVMLIEGEEDLALFCRRYGVRKEEIRQIY